jgi:hypothetical protein
LMETSRWFEVVTHPVTGKRTTLQADTEVLLELQLAAWHLEFDDPGSALPITTGAVVRA